MLFRSPDVQLLINHGGLPIARTGKNMSLSEDASGLVVDARLNPALPLVDELPYHAFITQSDAGAPSAATRPGRRTGPIVCLVWRPS